MDKEFHLYNDIRERTGGEIYIGVVGPVRTGKSTFIKRFMDVLVLPNMEDRNANSPTVKPCKIGSGSTPTKDSNPFWRIGPSTKSFGFGRSNTINSLLFSAQASIT